MIVTTTIALLVAQTVAGAAINKRHEYIYNNNTPCAHNNTASSSIASYQASEPSPIYSNTTSTPYFYLPLDPTDVASLSSTIFPSRATISSSSAESTLSSPTSGFYLADSSSTPDSSSFGSSTSSSVPVCTSSCSGAAVSSTILSTSSVAPQNDSATVSSILPYSSAGIASGTTGYPASQLSASAIANSGSFTVPQSSGYSVGQQSSLSAQAGISSSNLSTRSSIGCVVLTTETVYVTAPEPTRSTLTTVHVTSTQFVTVYGPSSSVIPLSSIVPTLGPGLRTTIDGQSSSSVIFTIPEPSMVPSPSPSSGAITSVLSSSLAPFTFPSSSATGLASLAPSIQPTPSYYAGAPSSSFGARNMTSTNLTSTALPASLTSVVSASFSSSILLPSNTPIASLSGGYSMAPNSTAAISSASVVSNTVAQSSVSPSSTFVVSHSTSQSTSRQGATETVTRIPAQSSTAVLAVPTTLPPGATQTSPAVRVVPTTLPPGAVGNDAYEAAYKADKMYKRGIKTIHIALDKTASDSSPKLVPTSKSSPGPIATLPAGSTNPPKPTPVPTSKTSSKSASGDRSNTVNASQDPRCPYPYPGIHCGKPTVSTTMVKNPTTTTKISDAKKTGSVSWCPYPYPGGKGEACP